MTLANTPTRYGAVTKTFHWLTALMILAIIPLGIFANDLAHQIRDPGFSGDEALIDRATWLFSAHKTLGVTIFLTALLRILWALTQTKPGLLNGDRRLESWLAETVHWLLYGSLVVVPLTGWIHHAATTGFAPIWWPFGQGLPFVPRSEALAALSATLHYVFQWVLIGAVTLHVAGALKHHVVDGDSTLRRMLPGDAQAQPSRRQPGHALPLFAALVIWAGVLGGAAALGWFTQDQAGARAPLARQAEPEEGNWQVEEGELAITVRQMGSEVTGRFSDWTAAITYAETADADGRHGAVEVTVTIPSLSLGSVTDQAMGQDFFHAEEFPTARFDADIVQAEDGKLARGTLTIRDQSVDVEMPFDLEIDGDTASADGGLRVDRRDFNIGAGVEDEGTLAFDVGIRFDLTAMRAAE